MIEKSLIIALISLLFFSKTLIYGYASDDIPVARRPRAKNRWRHLFNVLEGCARHSTQSDHLITTVIHTIICVLIYFAFGANDVSFIAALLFCLNPINNQVSVWISGRGYALATLGMLGALAIPFLAPVFLLICTYTNSGFISPLVLLTSNVPMVCIFLPFCWMFHVKQFKTNVLSKAQQEMFAEDKALKPEKLILAVKTFGFYLVHSIIPIKTTFYHSFLQSLAGTGAKKGYSIKCRFFWIGLASLIGILSYWITHKWDMVSFSLLWWCVCITPFLNIFRMHQEIAERYTYLPNVGLMFVLATVLSPYPVAVAFFLGMYSTKLWFWMDAYQDEYYLAEFSHLASPDAWFPLHIRAMKRWEAKSHNEAIIFWMMAKNLSPNEFKLNFNLASALRMSALKEHQDEAKKLIKVAEDNMPKGQESQLKPLIEKWHNGEGIIVL